MLSDDRGEIVWHPVFLDFARYWGFRPRLCRPYRAQTKGKASHCTPLAESRKDAIASYSDDHMHAALEVNIPNYASAIVTADEIIVAISSLAGIEVAARS